MKPVLCYFSQSYFIRLGYIWGTIWFSGEWSFGSHGSHAFSKNESSFNMVHQSSNLLKSHDRYVWGKHLFSGSESDHWFLSKGFVNESNSNLYFRDVNNNLLAHNTASATGHVIHLLFFWISVLFCLWLIYPHF